MSEAGPAGPAAASPSAPVPASPAPGSADPIGFLQALGGLVEARKADGRNMAVLLIECGVIGRIDGAWGYGVGDAVRARIAASLRTEVLRPDDLVGELGRDELACVLATVAGADVALLAAEKSLRALSAAFWVGDEEIFADPAIGIAMFPAHGDQAQALLQRARGACDVARGVATRVAWYAEDREDPVAARFRYENRLRTAVSEDALEMVFQPQYDLRLGQIMGAESLLRWRDGAPGMIAAKDAFAAAESAGKVSELVSSIMNRALRNCSEFRYSAGLDLRIGVNIPGRALLHAELPEIIERALRTWSLRPGRLIIEVEDLSVLGTQALARETLARLKSLGVKLSIDDPALALSWLFWLADLPFQEMKIDVSSARDPAGAPKSARILQSIIELAHHLKLEVVALGVADEEAAIRFKGLGCDTLQGDYKGPALAAPEFVARFGIGEEQ